MTDPQHGAEWLLQIFGGLAASAITGLVTAMGWFRKQRISLTNEIALVNEALKKESASIREALEEETRRVEQRVDSEFSKVWGAVQTRVSEHADHKTELAVMKMCLLNTSERLTEIATTTKEFSGKLERIMESINRTR